jgi:hypothetical protein
MNKRTASEGGQLQPEPESPLDLEVPDWRVALGDTVLRIKEDGVTLTGGRARVSTGSSRSSPP